MVVVIDPQIAGVSGDMLLCSLVSLGADKDRIIQGIRRSAKFFAGSQILHIGFEEISKHGINSHQLVLDLSENNTCQRSGSEIKKAISDSVMELGLSEQAAAFANSCIDTLISSESAVHGIPKNTVHLHEASSIDTIVDIIGVTIALEDLHFFDEKVVCMPVSVGGGSVTFSHGTMSNPASAILEIFKNSNLAIKGSDAGQEITTPTGACILVNLADESATHYPLMQVDSVGYGAGQKDFEEFSNVLKIVKGSEGDLTVDSVKTLETNLDDVSGEILGNLIEKIMKNGALDISIYSGITKKGRPTNLVSIICTSQTADNIVDTLISETGTLGVRISDSKRFVVLRSTHVTSVTLDGQPFQVHYKRSSFKGKTRFKVEFDDLKKISDTFDKSIKETELLLRKEIEKLENHDDIHR